MINNRGETLPILILAPRMITDFYKIINVTTHSGSSSNPSWPIKVVTSTSILGLMITEVDDATTMEVGQRASEW